MKDVSIYFPAHWSKEGQEAGLEHLQGLLGTEDVNVLTVPYEHPADVSTDKPAIIVLPDTDISQLARYYTELKAANPLHVIYYDEEVYDIEGDDRHSLVLDAVGRMFDDNLVQAMKAA